MPAFWKARHEAGRPETEDGGQWAVGGRQWTAHKEAWTEGIEDEWLEWFRLTPAQRWQESGRLWDTFRLLRGTLDEQPDSQSPFRDAGVSGPVPPERRWNSSRD